jgi:hypothetical protein
MDIYLEGREKCEKPEAQSPISRPIFEPGFPNYVAGLDENVRRKKAD